MGRRGNPYDNAKAESFTDPDSRVLKDQGRLRPGLRPAVDAARQLLTAQP